MHHGCFTRPRWLRVFQLLVVLLVLPKRAERPFDSEEVEGPNADGGSNDDAQDLGSGKDDTQDPERDPHTREAASSRESSETPSSKVQKESPELQRTEPSEEPQDSCSSIFKDPRNWQVFPRIGRTTHWTATASVVAKGTSNATEGIANAFRGFPDVIEKVNDDSFTNVFLRPGADVILRPGLDLQSCPWTGGLSLSTNEDCSEEVPEEEESTSKSKTPELVRSYTQEGLHVYRLALRKQYLVAQFKEGDLGSMSLEAKDIQYFLCVKPSGQHVKPEAIHFFWYKRDADGQSVKTLFATPFKDMLTSWIFKNSIVMDEPLHKELIFQDCSKTRWEYFDNARHASVTDEVRIHAALRALHDDCLTLLPKPEKIAPHSAMLLCFQIRHSEGKTIPDGESVATGAVLPRTVAMIILAMTILVRSRELSP